MNLSVSVSVPRVMGLLAALASLAVCSPVSMAIDVERPGGVAERIVFKYDDPNVALRSYAAAETVDLFSLVGTRGCTGVMIGPNTLMSAAHCNSDQKLAIFIAYRPDTVQRRRETFVCTYLTHTYPDSDLVLFDCASNERGENPGDRFGYIDFDVTTTRAGRLDISALLRNGIAANAPLYSVWQNPIWAIDSNTHAVFGGPRGA